MDTFQRWLDALEERHMRALSFQEVRRSVQALSSLYVERRSGIGRGAALDGAGKRAAFATYFAPLHFLVVREIVKALGAAQRAPRAVLDLGCGTGAAGAAWALESDPHARVIGVDRNHWAVQEARWTYSAFGLSASVQVADINTLKLPAGAAVVAAFCMNELPEEARTRWRLQFLQAAERHTPILVVEPIAGRLSPWWDQWAREWSQSGGRQDEWHFQVSLPERLALMDKAAGLDHRKLTARSLWFDH
jgi:hypothetical protein